MDAGLSGKEIEKRLQSRNLSADTLDAVIVSHEHSDHISGAGVMARRYDIPAYFSEETHQRCEKRVGKIKNLRYFECGESFYIGEVEVHPISLSHDAADPSAFTFSNKDFRVGYATDIGVSTHLLKQYLMGCHLIVLESNYDPVMLENNEIYSWELKQRIKSRLGHLSNEESRDLIKDILNDNLKHVVLAHLSEENNTPELALACHQPMIPSHITLEAASQHQAGKVYVLK